MDEIIWPDGIRCAAVFTFDNDDESGIIDAYGAEKMFYLSQGYYDMNAGTQRVLRILARQQIKATFCMVGKTAEKRPDVVKLIQSEGHELAVHGWDHRPYYNMKVEDEKEDIRKTIEIVQKITGRRPVGHRTPDWNPSRDTVRLLHELGGFIWRGDSLDNDLPYIHGFSDGSIVELPSAVTLDDFDNYVERGYSPQEVYELWRDEFDVLYEEGKFYCLTMHPLVTGRPAASKSLEKIITHVKSHEGVWVATAEEVARWWLKNQK
ncbi:MAG: polysaccharide deacetylase family protein [Thaumarchaeota archaeon]|nr:polysaccharide deacetylase family protein [Nitrososphaerota archaeon]